MHIITYIPIIMIITTVIASSNLRYFTGNYPAGQMLSSYSGFKYQIITISLIRVMFPVQQCFASGY